MNRGRAFLITVVGAVIFLGVLGGLLMGWKQTVGHGIVADSPNGGMLEADLRDVTELVLGVYADVVALITTAFGAIAFLLAWQREKRAVLTGKAWALLSGGIMLLTGGLIVCLASREVLLTMIARNAVELSLPALLYGRWATYLCLVLAAVCVSFFAIEAASAPEPIDTANTGGRG